MPTAEGTKSPADAENANMESKSSRMGASTKRPSTDYYHSLIECLPLETIEYAFAYGSGAVVQRDEDLSDKMVDFVVVAKDSLKFHRENLARNARHYSLVPRFLGAEKVELLQSKFGARIYYNTRVLVPQRHSSGSRLIKYGIISVEDLQADLLDWCWLYVAGRLHKPVLDVIPSKSEELTRALAENRKNALQAALLQLPDSFPFDELFTTIASLSYMGDFRMHFGEDRDKMKKLVSGAYVDYMRLYLPMLREDTRVQINGYTIQQDNSTRAIYHRLNLLPSELLHGLANFYREKDLRVRDLEEVTFAMAHRHDVALQVRNAVTDIVKRVTMRQTLKNAFTAGFLNSVLYSSAKMMKMVKSLRR